MTSALPSSWCSEATPSALAESRGPPSKLLFLSSQCLTALLLKDHPFQISSRATGTKFQKLTLKETSHTASSGQPVTPSDPILRMLTNNISHRPFRPSTDTMLSSSNNSLSTPACQNASRRAKESCPSRPSILPVMPFKEVKVQSSTSMLKLFCSWPQL